MATIGGKLCGNHPKNMTNVYMEYKDLVSVILTLGGNVRGWETVFYDGMEISDLGSIAHVFKHLHKIMIFGSFKKTHEGTLRRGHRSVISYILTKQILPHFYHHGDRFYNQYIEKTDKKRYIDDDDTRVKPKHFLQKGMG